MTEDTGEASSLQAALATNMESADVKLKQLDSSMKNFKVSVGSSKWMADLVDEMTEFFDVLNTDNLSAWEKFLYNASYMLTGGQGEIVRQGLLASDAAKTLIVDNDNLKTALLSNTEHLSTAYSKLRLDNKNLTFEEIKDVQSFLDQSEGMALKDTDTKLNNYRKMFSAWNDEVVAETERLDSELTEAEKAKALEKKEWREFELDARNDFNEEAHTSNVSFAKKEKKTAEEIKAHKLLLIQLELGYLQDVLAKKGITAEAEVNMKKRVNALLLKEMQIQSAKEIKDETQKQQVKAQLQQQAVALAANVLSDSIQSRIDADEAISQKKLDHIDKELAAGLITQRMADKEKEKIDKESFKRRKRWELNQATIGWIQELVNIRIAAAANPLNSVTFGAAGISQYTILAALATAAYAHNRSQINAQTFARGGVVYGNSHAQGGERFAVGGRVAELEGGEAVINKRSTSMFGNALSAMNVAGGGKSFASPNLGGGSLINYGRLGAVIGQNTNVVLPVESLNKVQNRVKTIESTSKF